MAIAKEQGEMALGTGGDHSLTGTVCACRQHASHPPHDVPQLRGSPDPPVALRP